MVAKIAITILLWLVQESNHSVSAFCIEWANQQSSISSELQNSRHGRVQRGKRLVVAINDKRKGITRQWIKKLMTYLNLKPPQQNAVLIIYAFDQQAERKQDSMNS